MTALYVGGMGAPELNFHAQVYTRMGYGEQVEEIGRLFRAGRKDDAAAVVPDDMVTETMIIGNVDEVRADVKRWADAGVTTLLVSCRDAPHVRQLASAVLG
jgi:alkanesulfonate monooxygenase SsuD/methylene tetrahydromethanopterin reductase-like flavin-dependent oxidoreductase (luciferase family)